jgi:ABC-type phosphate transport system substrate-binding protein
LVKAVAVVVLGGVLAGEARAAEGTPAYKVIVHPSVTGRSVPRAVLAQVYLGSVTRWGDGQTIAPVDLSSTSPVRKAFSEEVLGLSVDGVRVHWLRRISAGQRPPLSKASDDEVIAFVAAQKGAVGYVSAAAPLPATVQPLAIQ